MRDHEDDHESFSNERPSHASVEELECLQHEYDRIAEIEDEDERIAEAAKLMEGIYG